MTLSFSPIDTAGKRRFVLRKTLYPSIMDDINCVPMNNSDIKNSNYKIPNLLSKDDEYSDTDLTPIEAH